MDDDPSLVIKNLIKNDEHINTEINKSKQQHQQQKKIKLNDFSIYDCIDDKNFDDSNHDYNNKNKFSFIKYSSSNSDLVNNNVQFKNETNKNYVRQCFIIACNSLTAL